MHAMMSDRTGRQLALSQAVISPAWADIPWRQPAGEWAEAEARRILNVAEADGVHHDILPGLLRYDLQPMRDLCDALSAFVSAPDPAAYLAELVTR